jgi:hypothetical protein
MQSMSETEAIYLVLTAVACMTLAFLSTVAAVLGYFLELETFDEVRTEVAKMWIVMPIFLPVTGIPQLFQTKAHPFGAGGWFSTYLVVCGMAAISVTGARSRSNKIRRHEAWEYVLRYIVGLRDCCALYGRYGVFKCLTSTLTTTFWNRRHLRNLGRLSPFYLH